MEATLPAHKPMKPAQRSRAADLIVRTVAAEHGYTPLGLKAPGRPERIARPRQIAMLLIRDLTGASYPEVAAVFGKKDHSTIMHAERRINSLTGADASFAGLVASLRSRCQQLLRDAGLR